MEIGLMSKEFGKDCPCPYCGSSNIEETAQWIKCLDCGMGKYKVGKGKPSHPTKVSMEKNTEKTIPWNLTEKPST